MAEGRRRPEGGLLPLFLDLITGAARLWRGELALAKAEARRAGRDAAIGLLLVLFALLLALVALNTFVVAAVSGLTWLGLAPHWAALFAGLFLLLVALLLTFLALRRLRRATAFPQRQIRSVKRDVATFLHWGDSHDRQGPP